MFEHYNSNVQVGHNCDCHGPSNVVPEQHTPAIVTKDDLGNITKLQWAPDARFTINLTSDTNISIIEGSQILNRSGLTPELISGWEGLYAYNIIDSICWQFKNGGWQKLPNIMTSNTNAVVVTFGNDQATTKVSIKNFRGETIFSDTEKGNFVPLTVDDSLASILMQGFYNIDIYQITPKYTKLIRRIPLSVSQAKPAPKPPIVNNNHNNKSFVTDNTLSLRNGVLSVNLAEQCQPGGMLPVTGNAVFEFAQPRNLIVEADLETYTASVGSADIFNYQMMGGDVSCLVAGIYLSPISITAEKATFKELILDDNIITSYVLTVDFSGKITDYKVTKSPLNSAQNLDSIQEALAQQISTVYEQHIADTERMDASIASMSAAVDAMQTQIGDVKVTEKIVELYNNYNRLNTSINNLSSELDDKLEASDVDTIVVEKIGEHLDEDRLQEIIDKIVAENLKFDGGVVE